MPGVARRQVTFLCFAKRKVTKEKATRRLGPFAVATGNLRCSTPAAVQTTRLRLKQVWPDLPPPSALLGPASTGWGVNSGSDSGSLKREALDANLWAAPPNPWRGAEKHRARRIRAETCLSEASCFRPRLDRASQGAPQGTTNRVAFSFGYFAFGEAKEK